jgi:hypothetical protein
MEKKMKRNKCYPKFRATFGILDSNGKQYPDIIRSFLELRYITKEDIMRGYLDASRFHYILHVDGKTGKEIERDGYAKCIISFQHRTTGLFAIVRLFEQERTSS